MSVINDIRNRIRDWWQERGYRVVPGEPLVHPLFSGFNPSAGEALCKQLVENSEMGTRTCLNGVSLRPQDRGGTWPHTALFEMIACISRPHQSVADEVTSVIELLRSFEIWPLWAKIWPGGEKEGLFVGPDDEVNSSLRSLGVGLVSIPTEETLLWWNQINVTNTINVAAPRAEIYFGNVEVAMVARVGLTLIGGQLTPFSPIWVSAVGLDRLAGILLGYRPCMDDLADELAKSEVNRIDALRAVDAFRTIVLSMSEGAIPGGNKKRSRRSYILRQFFHDLLAIELRYPSLNWDEIYRDFGQKLREHFEGVHKVGIDELFAVLPRERELVQKLARSTRQA